MSNSVQYTQVNVQCIRKILLPHHCCHPQLLHPWLPPLPMPSLLLHMPSPAVACAATAITHCYHLLCKHHHHNCHYSSCLLHTLLLLSLAMAHRCCCCCLHMHHFCFHCCCRQPLHMLPPAVTCTVVAVTGSCMCYH